MEASKSISFVALINERRSYVLRNYKETFISDYLQILLLILDEFKRIHELLFPQTSSVFI